MNNTLQVEVLYFKGCPNHEPAVEQVRQALKAEGVMARVREIEIENAAMAQDVGFLGSPSVRINGMDVEESARDAKAYGFGCRTYFEGNIRSGLPPIGLIRNALLQASGVQSSSCPCRPRGVAFSISVG